MDVDFVADGLKYHPLSITTNTTLASLHSQVRRHLHIEDEPLSLMCSVQDPFDTYTGSSFKPLREDHKA